MLVGIICQVALLDEMLAKLRFFFRCAPFLASLALLFLPGARRRHPAQIVPLLTSRGIARVLPPESGHIRITACGCGTIRTLLCNHGPHDMGIENSDFLPEPSFLSHSCSGLFHTMSSLFGVLQSLYPGQYQPAVSKAIDRDYLENLKITLADGSTVFRPMGLTDIPGMRAVRGLCAILFGLGLLLSMRSRLIWIAAAFSMGLGFYVIYLSMVRVNLVTIGITVCAAGIAFAVRKDWIRIGKLSIVVGASAILAFFLALSVGGQAVEDRISTLTESSAGSVYYQNRGFFITYMIEELLPKYPLGAGPGHFGMMAFYFGRQRCSNYTWH